MNKFKRLIPVDENVYLEIRMRAVPKSALDEYQRFLAQYKNKKEEDVQATEVLIVTRDKACELALKYVISKKFVNDDCEPTDPPDYFKSDYQDIDHFITECFPAELQEMFNLHNRYYVRFQEKDVSIETEKN